MQEAHLKAAISCQITVCNGKHNYLHAKTDAQDMTLWAYLPRTILLILCTDYFFLKLDMAETLHIFLVLGIMCMHKMITNHLQLRKFFQHNCLCNGIALHYYFFYFTK